LKLNEIRQHILNLFDLNANARITILDGLRAWAILSVFNMHFMANYSDDNYLTVPGSYLYRFFITLHSGHIGVELFFVISGYLIFNMLKKRPVGLFTFSKRRLERLLPANAAILIFIAIFASTASFKTIDFIYNLFFIAPLLKNVRVYNIITWSLAWEWIFYFIIFFSVALFKRLSDFIHIFICLMISGLVSILNRHGVIPEYIEFGRFTGFSFGILLSILISNREKLRLKQIMAFLFPIALLGIPFSQVYWSFNHNEIVASPIYGFYFIYVDAFFTIITFYLMTNKGLIYRFFNNICFRFVGKISYSFYLIHIFTIDFVLRTMPRATEAKDLLLTYICSLFFTILISAMSYLLFERIYFRRTKNKSAKFQIYQEDAINEQQKVSI
jgi:peptidoglycan/LPS O-acetylase OafA/YrhL